MHELAQGRILPAAVLLRSHLETAALAVYCLDTLSDCARRDAIKPLTEFVQKTLFGTALAKYLGKDHRVSQMLSSAETRTIQILRAMEALDRYINQDKAVGEIGVFYGALCEYAHPNHRGVMALKESDPRGDGWMIRYTVDEPFDTKAVAWVVGGLTISMRAGYSASELLRSWDFRDTENGLEWIWPDSETTRRVWTAFIHLA